MTRWTRIKSFFSIGRDTLDWRKRRKEKKHMEELQNGNHAIVDFPEFDKGKAHRQATRSAVGGTVGALGGYEFTDDFWFNFFTWLDTYYPYILPWPDSWNAGMASLAGAILGALLAYGLGWLNNTMRYRADKKAAAQSPQS